MSDLQTPNLGPGATGNPKADAKAAKAYAKASRTWYQKKRWWLAGLVLVAIIASAMGGGGGDSDDDTTATDSSSSDTGTKKKAASSQKESETEPVAKTVKVPAAAILKEFEGNEAAADAKYRDKLLEVSGVVSKVDTELLDDSEYVVQVNGGGDFEFTSVNCDDQASGDVVPLKIGQDITVVGDFEDGGDLGVELKNCTIK